jgi:hypothetical protein
VLYVTFNLTALLGLIGPWLQQFFKLGLISDYFQPGVNSAATGFAALAFLVTAGVLRGRSPAYLKKLVKIGLLVLVISFSACLIFRYTVGTVWMPDRLGTVTLWLVWIIMYVAFFTSFSIVLCTAALLTKKL